MSPPHGRRSSRDCRGGTWKSTFGCLFRHYRFISMKDAVDMLTGRKPVVPHSVVITFDDAYRNHLTHALPITQQYGAPAMVFVPTGLVESRKPFWFDRLDFCLQHAPADGRIVHLAGASIRLCSRDRQAFRRAFKTFKETAKSACSSDIRFLQEAERLMSSLEAESRLRLESIIEQDKWSAVLSWNDLWRTDYGCVAFGSHTVNHTRLGLVDSEKAHAELAQSKEAIERHTGRPCVYLCYPNGSFNEDTVSLAKACGYEAALTSREGSNRVGDDVMRLRRISVPMQASSTELLAQVCGLSDAIWNLKSRFMSLLRSPAWRGVNSTADSFE